MAAIRTEITEIITGLAMLGFRDLDEALQVRPMSVVNLDTEHYERLAAARAAGSHDHEFETAWANGQVFARADDGLRGRPPWTIEWKGPHKPPGYEQVPADLRIDHVYLVSCKYGSSILHNASPSHLFERSLAEKRVERGSDWFIVTAPEAYQEFYEACLLDTGLATIGSTAPGVSDTGFSDAGSGAIGFSDTAFGDTVFGDAGSGAIGFGDTGLSDARSGGTGLSDAGLRDPGLGVAVAALPSSVAELDKEHRQQLKAALPKRGRLPDKSQRCYEHFSLAVAMESAERWRASLTTAREREAMLWRLLRLQAAPYFVLGATTSGDPLRYRVGTPWDFRNQFEMKAFDTWPDSAGQPMVRWRAEVTDRATNERVAIEGHVEIRWTHGRFSGAPEAKVHLDTHPHDVPGYFPLT